MLVLTLEGDKLHSFIINGDANGSGLPQNVSSFEPGVNSLLNPKSASLIFMFSSQQQILSFQISVNHVLLVAVLHS